MRGPAAFLALVALAGCEPVDVRLLFLPDGGEIDQEVVCTESGAAACIGDTFCEKLSCGASTGKCHRPPTGCGSTYDPVCGCDQVNYFNDCYRRAARVSLRNHGECATPKGCGPQDPCPEGAVCAHLFGAACGTADGTCWSVPPVCPPGAPSYLDCGDLAVCRDVCQAVISLKPFGYFSPRPCQ